MPNNLDFSKPIIMGYLMLPLIASQMEDLTHLANPLLIKL